MNQEFESIVYLNETEEMELYRVVMGCILHDIGKIVYRAGNVRVNHSELGERFLREEIGITETKILEQVKFHHKKLIDITSNKDLSLAYISYIADNLSANGDRRKDESEHPGWIIYRPLKSIFNLINNCNDRNRYPLGNVLEEASIYSVNRAIYYPKESYKKMECEIAKRLSMLQSMQSNLADAKRYINTLLELFEYIASTIPSSTSSYEVCDISLYDHLKTTAAYGACIYQYILEHENITLKSLFKKSEAFYNEAAFLLYSFDLSGIQSFIYTITSKGALKGLRARSFYLELLCEHIADLLLTKLHLSRVNLIYLGGGHAYILLANTERVKKILDAFDEYINEWLLEQFEGQLYMASASIECCKHDFNDWSNDKKEENRKRRMPHEVFHLVDVEIAKRKLTPYNAKMLRFLNQEQDSTKTDECEICKRAIHRTESGKCNFCENLLFMSPSILNKKDAFRVVKRSEIATNRPSLPLPKDYVVISVNPDWNNEKSLHLYSISKRGYKKRVKTSKYVSQLQTEGNTTNRIVSNQGFQCNDSYFHQYERNAIGVHRPFTSKIWMADYAYCKAMNQSFEDAVTFENLYHSSQGIKRLGILRADVDDLGTAFAKGFIRDKNVKKAKYRYVTLSRTATFSRKMSLYFKYFINHLLKHGKYFLDPNRTDQQRNAVVVYSGGDDLFIVGSWDDIIGFAIDLQQSFQKYTQNTLTISAGIGVFPLKYPISLMATQTGELLKIAKQTVESTGEKGKNRVVLFSKEHSYSWEQFQESVLKKYEFIRNYFDSVDSNGMTFLNHIYELLRHDDKPIQMARLYYLLSRLEPKNKKSEAYEKYHDFSKQILQWTMQGIMNDSGSSNNEKIHIGELKTAILLYLYLRREGDTDEFISD